jgi:Asp-tRNA(Asn)/Glu-tRNA(Gln) amidotransferase A subunit family amidase
MKLYSASLVSNVADLRNGGRKLHAYIDEMCDRIDALDGQIRALLPEPGRRARLHAEADALLVAYPSPLDRPRLFGALVGVKDIFHVDGFATGAGSELPPERLTGPEARCVRDLRTAGALIVGKTVTTEFAFFEPGPTRNPHHLDHTPGGSSSGSAAAVAAGFCQLAVGTQTIGSVIRPAAFCGIVGFKPSYDRIATQGLLYFSHTVDHVGLFTQTITGMQLAASVLIDGWNPEPTTLPRPVLGVPDGPFLAQTEPAALASFEQTLGQLQAAGYTVKLIPALADIAELNVLHRRLVAAEFAQEHAPLFAEFAERYRPRTRELIETGQAVSSEELATSRAHCDRLRVELHELMAAAGIDLWVCPAAPGPAPVGLQNTGDPNLNLPWTHAGLPAITVPAGRAATGLPLGLQLIAPFSHDEQLLAWAPGIGAIVQ